MIGDALDDLAQGGRIADGFRKAAFAADLGECCVKARLEICQQQRGLLSAHGKPFLGAAALNLRLDREQPADILQQFPRAR